MQVRPNMEAVNKHGLSFGGLDNSALSNDVICKDGGSWNVSTPKRVTITEHEVGNLHYEYNHDDETYQLKSGASGVTGRVSYSPSDPCWISNNSIELSGNNYVYEKINTDMWGNPLSVQHCYTQTDKQTVMWSPQAREGGVLWRRMGKIINEECDLGSGATWGFTAVNENNAFVLPVPRHYGWGSPTGNTLNVAKQADICKRYPNGAWVSTVLYDEGLTTPIQGVGELGGVFIYNTFCGSLNNDARMGIGIASGIEFYDPVSYECSYNACSTRPYPTTACIPFGPEGKYGNIKIQSLNPFAPWQFMLSGYLDIGSIDPGSYPFDPCDIPLADGPICSTRTYYGWEGRYSQPPGLPDQTNGLMDGSVTRLLNRDILWCGTFGNWCATFRPGEINMGGLGIGTAQFEWTSNFSKETPSQGTIKANRNGGLVTGIATDSSCRPYIDANGFIHTPNKDFTTCYLVSPSQSKLRDYGQTNQVFKWEPERQYAYTCEKSGKLNGRVESISIDNIRNLSITQPCGGTVHYMFSESGEVRDGTVGIGIAQFDPSHKWWNKRPPCDIVNCGTVSYAWNNGGGLLRGVMADISLEQALHQAPYIDCNGILHIVHVDRKAFTCCNSYCRSVSYYAPTRMV